MAGESGKKTSWGVWQVRYLIGRFFEGWNRSCGETACYSDGAGLDLPGYASSPVQGLSVWLGVISEGLTQHNQCYTTKEGQGCQHEPYG